MELKLKKRAGWQASFKFSGRPKPENLAAGVYINDWQARAARLCGIQVSYVWNEAGRH